MTQAEAKRRYRKAITTRRIERRQPQVIRVPGAPWIVAGRIDSPAMSKLRDDIL
jgi:hypothetical protein